MPDENKAENDGNNNKFDDYDDPFTMKMKEIGIDWNKLQDGIELDFDQERQTIHLGNDCLLSQSDVKSDAK